MFIRALAQVFGVFMGPPVLVILFVLLAMCTFPH